MRTALIVLLCVFAISGVAIFVTTQMLAQKEKFGLNIEVKGAVTYVGDGDTIHIKLTWVDRSREGIVVGASEKVRFAGIDAPELEDEGGSEARNLVLELCPEGSEVSLDLDDLATTGGLYRDRYGRLVAVIYVRKENVWINVNAEVLRWGQEAYPGHDWLKYAYLKSEFNPYEWLENDYPYVRK
jgi:endonuclease YncB( thermonuclease family)